MNTIVYPHPSTRGLARLLELAGVGAAGPACEQFYFLRHGQTACNARRIFQAADEPLDATGEAQARRAAATLAGTALSSIVCSEMPRAHHTARAVAAGRDLALHVTAGLRERNFGHLIGSSSRELDWTCDPAGGESLDAFVLRSRAGLAEALAKPAPVLVVAHGGTFYVLAGWLGIDVSTALLGNALPLRFDRGVTGWRATALDIDAVGEANLS